MFTYIGLKCGPILAVSSDEAGLDMCVHTLFVILEEGRVVTQRTFVYLVPHVDATSLM
jgi:hypothetical protein